MPKYHFLEYDAKNICNPHAPFAVLPIPYEHSVSYGRGTAKAPAAILKASVQTELFDEEFFCPQGLRVQTLPAINCHGTNSGIFARIRRTAESVLRSGRFLMSFGGEHSITFPLVAAAQAVHKEISVLSLDAHLDLRDSYKNNCLSHACVFRRIMEINVPVTHVGIRSLCREEYDLVKRHHLNVYWAREILAAAGEGWIATLIAGMKNKVYISIDADVLDLAIMPGTGTPEPGGLSWQTVLTLLRRICLKRTVIAADIVEVIPLPNTPVCEYTAAKLALKLMTYSNYSGSQKSGARIKNKSKKH
ncbi:MAG: agmatinase [Kiritimatiellia bacterium]|nr:agmatinase [Kiritimatiellia bacterium]